MSEVRITDPATGGMKGQKPERFELLAWGFLSELARVAAFGAAKYDDHNWLKGYKWGLNIGALYRHVTRFVLGESIDPESGCHHLAHAAWHCMAIYTFERERLGTDDRPAVLREASPPKPEPIPSLHADFWGQINAARISRLRRPGRVSRPSDTTVIPNSLGIERQDALRHSHAGSEKERALGRTQGFRSGSVQLPGL